jgi:hypothetical protein
MRYVTHNGQAVLQPELASDANSTTSQRNHLTTIRDYSTGLQPCSSRGASGGDPEGGAKCGVSRLRLVTADSGGPVPRPPGTTTWLRGARCTDPEEMPEMEARDPAENRHGGAPRGAPPFAKGGRHPRKVPGLQRYCRPRVSADTRAPVGAPPTPRSGWTRSKLGRKRVARPRQAV